MSHLLEAEFSCRVCGSVRPGFQCCGRDMEHDGRRFFCPKCGGERNLPECCDGQMLIRKRVRNIKKDIFSSRNNRVH